MQIMLRRYADLAAAVGIALITAALVLTNSDLGILRAVFVLLLVCVVPGYLFLAILFPQQRPEMPAALCLVPVLSLSFTLVDGVILNLGKWGLSGDAFAWSLSISTLIGAVVAFFRRRRFVTEYVPLPRIGVNAWQAALFSLALVIVVVAFITVRDGAAKPVSSFTQLWLIPSSVDDITHLVLGVKNEETEPMTYRLVVMNGSQILNEWPTLSLADNAQWQTVLSLPATIDTPIQALLYRADQPGVIYRNVTWRTGTSRK
jgi:uncharacterized membrane protein